MKKRIELSVINHYLAQKQHLWPGSRQPDPVQVTRDIVALHASAAVGPYLSLWARVPGFRRELLEDALFAQRSLAKVLCMRYTVHVAPGDEAPYFFQAYADRPPTRDQAPLNTLLVWAELCRDADAEALGLALRGRVLDVLREKGSATVREISGAVPELTARVRHSAGKKYEGEFSIGSRLLPMMCAEGTLIRGRPRGTWRSTQHEYAVLADWLPGVELASISPKDARTWLIRRYLAAFGPATPDDVKWWSGLSKTQVAETLAWLAPEIAQVTIEGCSENHLMLAEDLARLRDFTPPETPYAFLLPALDPYIMGYRDRGHFLGPEHNKKVFDPAGNAMPTVWADGRVAGLWGQRRDGPVVYRLFRPVEPAAKACLAEEAGRLEEFLAGEYLPPFTSTSFARGLA